MTEIPDVTKLPKPDLLFEAEGIDPIKMTYGLEMDLRRMLPDPQTAMQLMLYDTFTQDYVLRRCLTPLKKIISDPADLVDMEKIDLSSDDIERLMRWALEHALYFFAKRTSGMSELAVQFQLMLPKAPTKPSTDGSESLTSETPSAGDSISSKED